MTMRLLLALLVIAAAAAADDNGYDEVGRAGWGGRVIPPPLAVQAAHDLVPGQGGLVVRVRPGSTADRLGIQPGDIVLSLNDRPISTRRDIRDLMATVAPGDRAEAVVLGGDGRVRRLEGDFAARVPRPPGMPLWMRGPRDPAQSTAWRSPDEVIATQRAQLVAGQAQLARVRSDLAAARARLGEPAPAWRLRIAIATDAEAP